MSTDSWLQKRYQRSKRARYGDKDRTVETRLQQIYRVEKCRHELNESKREKKPISVRFNSTNNNNKVPNLYDSKQIKEKRDDVWCQSQFIVVGLLF